MQGNASTVSEFIGHILEKSAACGDDAAARIGYDELPTILRDAVPSELMGAWRDAKARMREAAEKQGGPSLPAYRGNP